MNIQIENEQKIKVVEPSISFNIGVENPWDFEYLYIVGSHEKLGAWDTSKAVRIKRSKRGAFNKTVKIAQGSTFEFKILADKSWERVEKGFYFEELPNRTATVADIKNKKIVEVKNFLF